MFKTLLLIFVTLIFNTSIYAQIENRKYIKGKINVPAKDDPENISVYNKTTKNGTVTDELGSFKIFAAVNDTLSIKSIQYDDFKVVVDREVFDNKTMTIYLKESISILDEVVVRPYDLSGNLKEDAQNIETLTMQPITASSKSIVYAYTGGQKYAADRQTSPEKAITDQSYFRYGLNFANLFKLLVNSKKNKSTKNGSKTFKNSDLREMYSNEFFKTYLKIPKNKINEFLTFLQKNGLNQKLLAKGSEMELIQFLIDKSRIFREEEL